MMPGMTPSMGSTRNVIPEVASAWDDIDGTNVGAGSNAAQAISGITDAILMRCTLSAVSTFRLTHGTLAAHSNGHLIGSCSIADADVIDFVCEPGAGVGFSAYGNGLSDWSFEATATITYRLDGSSDFTETLSDFDIQVSEYSTD